MSSLMHRYANLFDQNNLQGEQRNPGSTQYSNTKLFNVSNLMYASHYSTVTPITSLCLFRNPFPTNYTVIIIMYVFLWICCDILQVMAADSLQRRLTGKGVTVSALHPGFVSVHVM